jgi:hypothetical protein
VHHIGMKNGHYSVRNRDSRRVQHTPVPDAVRWHLVVYCIKSKLVLPE